MKPKTLDSLSSSAIECNAGDNAVNDTIESQLQIECQKFSRNWFVSTEFVNRDRDSLKLPLALLLWLIVNVLVLIKVW